MTPANTMTPTNTMTSPIVVRTNEVVPISSRSSTSARIGRRKHPEGPGQVVHLAQAVARVSKERFHEAAAEVGAGHCCLHGAQDGAQTPEEACGEPREEARRCRCPCLARHDEPSWCGCGVVVSLTAGRTERVHRRVEPQMEPAGVRQLGQQPQRARVGGCLGAAVHAQLVVEMDQVSLDSAALTSLTPGLKLDRQRVGWAEADRWEQWNR